MPSSCTKYVRYINDHIASKLPSMDWTRRKLNNFNTLVAYFHQMHPVEKKNFDNRNQWRLRKLLKRTFRNSEIKISKLRIYRVVVIKRLLYFCESWLLSRRGYRKLEWFHQMNFLISCRTPVRTESQTTKLSSARR